MPEMLLEQKDNTITVQFTVTLTGQMLEDEQSLLQSLNEGGTSTLWASPDQGKTWYP